jgi:Holliday junction resolvase RusA-like endonuclease
MVGHAPISFYLPIVVLAKHDSSRRGRVRAREAKVMENARAIQQHAMGLGPRRVWTCPIRLDLHFCMEVTKAMRKKGVADTAIGTQHTTTPDADNLRKQVADAFQGLFYEDDKQVCGGVTLQTWEDEPGVFVRIAEVKPADVQWLRAAIHWGEAEVTR